LGDVKSPWGKREKSSGGHFGKPYRQKIREPNGSTGKRTRNPKWKGKKANFRVSPWVGWGVLRKNQEGPSGRERPDDRKPPSKGKTPTKGFPA